MHRAPDADKLWVVTPISNPVRYNSRYSTFQKFKTGIERAGANLMVVELALGNRPFEVADTVPHSLKLRTNDELWHKENLINLGISRLPDDWKYVVWMDGDIEFIRHDWVNETIQQLQHYKIVQCFQDAIDLGPNGEFLKKMDGFVWSWLNHMPPPYSKGAEGPAWHPGYCWSATREAINDLGGLMEFPILGSSDHHMAWAMVGKVIENSPKQISSAYKKHLEMWQERCNIHIKQNIGYVPGTIYHHYHGSKKNRKYIERWQILLKHGYDPEFDLKRDWQGVLAFTDEGERMRNDIREYFRQRNEDSIDL